jgi:choline dehydrogenase
MLATLLQPTSRGTVRLRSSDPFDAPACDLQFLSTTQDRIVLRSAVRLCMRIVEEMQASGYAVSPFRAPSDLGDASVDAYIEEHSQSFFHYSSSCRMAPLDDPDGPGVVDDELRVHGIPNLRICDASVFPQVPAAHLQAPVVVVAERCADMINRSGQ